MTRPPQNEMDEALDLAGCAAAMLERSSIDALQGELTPGDRRTWKAVFRNAKSIQASVTALKVS